MMTTTMVLSLGLWGSLGCSLGPQHPSVLEDTQVVSVIAEPPEAFPGAIVSIQATVADPLERGADVLIWSCALYEGRCIEEAEYSTTPERWLSVETLSGDTVTVSREIPSEAYDLLQELGQSRLSTALLVLACAPGRCPIIEQAREALATGTVSTALAEDLADPTSWMARLPIAGVSLAGREFTIFISGQQNTNPWIEARFAARDDDPIVVSADGDQELAFFAQDSEDDRIYAYAYTTIGQFEDRRERVYDGVVRHYLLPRGQTGAGMVYIVFEDGEGGAALWKRAVLIR
jgi:hypothetical protein